MARATTKEAPKTTPVKPTHRLFMVQDRPNKPSTWTEIAGLWATRNGHGVSGETKFWLTIPPGTRLVAMEVKAST